MTSEAMAPTLRPDLLANRTAIVAGGTGSVGRVLVRAFLDAGARVVVPSRSEAKIAALREGLPAEIRDRLTTLTGDLSDEKDSARLLREILDRVGPPDAAVATLGGFVAAPSLLRAPLGDLNRALEGYLLAHFMVAKALIPALAERKGSYTFINGPLAFAPMFPGTGLISIATAGQAMLARTLMKEEAKGPVRINELVLYTSFGWSDAKSRGGSVSREDVGRYAALLASERGEAVRGQTIHLESLEPLKALLES